MFRAQTNSKFIYLPFLVLVISIFFFTQINNANSISPHQKEVIQTIESSSFFATPSEAKYDSIFNQNLSFVSQSFDFPVGKPNGKNYFKAREFGQQKHLGEDWNGVGGGNTDLGDPVYSISNGYVSFAENVCCGWGNIVRVVHKFPDHPEYPYVESFYAHLDQINVQPGDLIQRGQQVGTIGTANGKYSAHLHLEIRSFIDMGIGPGYSDDTFGFLVPTKFIQKY